MDTQLSDILKKIKTIRDKHNLSQDAIADKMNITQPSYARFERGATKTDLRTLINFCNCFNMSFMEFIHYPDKYIKPDNELKAVLHLELKKDKKEQVLKLVFGENNLEILKN